MTDSVIVSDEGAVRIIRFNRPEKKNALTGARLSYCSCAMAVRRKRVSRRPFDTALVRGITEIYNESPIRQGKPRR